MEFPHLVGLVARIKDSPSVSAKKGEPSALFTPFCPILTYFCVSCHHCSQSTPGENQKDQGSGKCPLSLIYFFLLLTFLRANVHDFPKKLSTPMRMSLNFLSRLPTLPLKAPTVVLNILSRLVHWNPRLTQEPATTRPLLFPWTSIKVRLSWPSAWILLTFTHLFSLVMPELDQERTQKVRLLPYVLVPNMDRSSRIFHKAEAILAKQTVSSTSSSTTPAARKAQFERLFRPQQGKSFFLLLLICANYYLCRHPGRSHRRPRSQHHRASP